MGQELFKYLPSEIILDILSRLPIPTTMSCKCVCKPWLDLISSPEFVKSHFSRSLPCLAVFFVAENSKPYKIFEFVDGLDVNCHWSRVFNFDLPFHESLHSSVNGLLFLYNRDFKPIIDLFLCNPITREYISLPSLPPCGENSWRIQIYGFGVSKVSCQYKVVRIYDEGIYNKALGHKPADRFVCHVYTVGSRSWRQITSDVPIGYAFIGQGVFLNGNLHFLASKDSSSRICCLDLETELFSIFIPPPCSLNGMTCRKLSVLRDHLCVCDNSITNDTDDYEINIWLMKEYGDEKSWTKEFISHKVDMGYPHNRWLRPLKVFKDGDILMEGRGGRKLLYYSNKTITVRVEGDLGGFSCQDTCSSATIYTPSFLPLKTFEMENVNSF